LDDLAVSSSRDASQITLECWNAAAGEVERYRADRPRGRNVPARRAAERRSAGRVSGRPRLKLRGAGRHEYRATEEGHTAHKVQGRRLMNKIKRGGLLLSSTPGRMIGEKWDFQFRDAPSGGWLREPPRTLLRFYWRRPPLFGCQYRGPLTPKQTIYSSIHAFISHLQKRHAAAEEHISPVGRDLCPFRAPRWSAG